MAADDPSVDLRNVRPSTLKLCLAIFDPTLGDEYLEINMGRGQGFKLWPQVDFKLHLSCKGLLQETRSTSVIPVLWDWLKVSQFLRHAR